MAKGLALSSNLACPNRLSEPHRNAFASKTLKSRGGPGRKNPALKLYFYRPQGR